MRKLLPLLLLLLLFACRSSPDLGPMAVTMPGYKQVWQRDTLPDPEPQGPERSVDAAARLLVYRFAQDVVDSMTTAAGATGQEQVACVTRWNPLWKGDSLFAVEVIAAVFIPVEDRADDFVYPAPAAGNCWWQLPSIHWHVLRDEDGSYYGPSPLDRMQAARSSAPFHLLAYGEGPDFYIYSVRLGALKASNAR